MYSKIPYIQLCRFRLTRERDMARHYSTRDFFRQMPNALLARYFQARGLFGDLDFSAMKESQPDELFAAWLSLPHGQRNEMDAEFRDIFELSCEKGFRAIIDAAEWHLTTGPDARTGFVENLAALSDHYERAMVHLPGPQPVLEGCNPVLSRGHLPREREGKAYGHTAAEKGRRFGGSSGSKAIASIALGGSCY